MTTNNYRLESGHEYTLKQLFNGKNRIVIPDLQRDYCWGDKAWNKEAKKHTELVSGFVDSLLGAFVDNADKLTLGLIYGYENPHFTIQLCDGQQRLTTLFLLVGMINRKTENTDFKNVLISEYEIDDDKETNLLYAIRESTLYFLSDLVCEFFLKTDLTVDDISKQDWYFKEYDLDASIQSMLSAIRIIENKLHSGVDCKRFGDFIINNLQMLYYDMGHRTRGEETFVIINTTGEPLTATENLKPILIGNIEDKTERNKASKEWEDREEWFWQNKRTNEQTSDEALKVFFIWYWQIRLLQEKSWKEKKSYTLNPNELFQKEPLVTNDEEETTDMDRWEQSKNLNTVHNYFNALEEIICKCSDDKIAGVLKSIHNKDISLTWFREVSLDVVLPIIAYVEKFGTKTKFYRFVRRIRKNFFDRKWQERNDNYLDWRHIIQIIELADNEEDVFKFETRAKESEFKKISNVKLNEWYNEEEKTKNELIKYQEEIEKCEDHQDFMGDLSFFFSLQPAAESIYHFADIQMYYYNYISIIDLIREKKDIPMSNSFRLFLLYIGCEKVEHKPRVSWDIEGVLFSTIGRNHLFNVEFKNLCSQKTNYLENYCLKFIKNKIEEWKLFDLCESNYTTNLAIKCWLTLKVFYANMNKVCLAYYDGNNGDEGVSVYKNMASNKLLKEDPFSISNMICGFGIKAGGGGSYINYTRKDLWLKPNIIDSPFAGIDYDDKNNPTKLQIEVNQKIISEIIEYVKALKISIS